MISGITPAFLLIGAFVSFLGIAIVSNAAFSGRAQFGFYVFLVGAVTVIMSVVDMIIWWLA
jgi:hypothetical protein